MIFRKGNPESKHIIMNKQLLISLYLGEKLINMNINKYYIVSTKGS